jgi:DNA-binding MarR family transcriptional regulator
MTHYAANMNQASESPTTVNSPNPPSGAQLLTDVVTRLRRALRTSIRTDYPWESLPMAQVELLMSLADNPPARIGQLASMLRLAPNTVSGLVQQLLEAGLASRETDPTDRRVARVALTEAGRRQLSGWQDAHEQRIESALGQLAPEDRAAVLTALPGLNQLATHLAEANGAAGR